MVTRPSRRRGDTLTRDASEPHSPCVLRFGRDSPSEPPEGSAPEAKDPRPEVQPKALPPASRNRWRRRYRHSSPVGHPRPQDRATNMIAPGTADGRVVAAFQRPLASNASARVPGVKAGRRLNSVGPSFPGRGPRPSTEASGPVGIGLVSRGKVETSPGIPDDSSVMRTIEPHRLPRGILARAPDSAVPRLGRSGRTPALREVRFAPPVSDPDGRSDSDPSATASSGSDGGRASFVAPRSRYSVARRGAFRLGPHAGSVANTRRRGSSYTRDWVFLGATRPPHTRRGRLDPGAVGLRSKLRYRAGSGRSRTFQTESFAGG